MKTLLTSSFLALSMGLWAQTATPAGPQQPTNSLLTPAFWQTKPNVEAVKAEIAKGNNPAELNASSFDPMVMAINSDAPTETVIFLQQQPGNEVNKLTHDARTYIFWSASKGNTELVSYFISKGARLDLQDSHGYSPLNFAAVGGQKNTAVYDLLIKNGAKPAAELDEYGANALLLAIGSDPDLKLTEYFQAKGLSLQSKDALGRNAFDYAARSGNLDLLKKLWDKKLKPTNQSMLMAAQGSRRGAAPLSVFQALEGYGASAKAVSKDGNNVLHFIARRPGQAELINYFLSKGLDVNAVNAEGNSAFMNAAASNTEIATLELLKPLVKNINATNKAGASAMALAVRGNSAEVVDYLLKSGAKTTAVDAKGNSLAAYLFEGYAPNTKQAFEAKLKLLQAAGINLAAPMGNGNTLFHLAMDKNNIDLLKKAKDLGADVNAKNKEGLTPLHMAAMTAKNDALLQYLVSAGAQKDIKTPFGETAYDLAIENEMLKKNKTYIEFLK